MTLNDRFDASGRVSLKAALAINDVGQILVREFVDQLEPPDYFVLTPVSVTD